MGCGCKKTPLMRIEARMVGSGWAKLANSELGVIDAFIFDKLGLYPNGMAERISMYGDAKKL